MDEFDENGWAHVHHAAYNGYYKSVNRFIKSREDQLELETQDGQQLTPLLLACMNGHVETVQLLVEELHANLKAKDRHLFGAVELAASKNHIKVLEYLLNLNSPDLQVWNNLIKGLSQSELETSCARALVELTTEENADFVRIPEQFKQGEYILIFDPLDGSSNVDVNVNVGTIFSILRRKSPSNQDVTLYDILQSGVEQVAAGYFLYGPSTMLVYSTGDGVHGFTLDPSVGEFLLSHPNLTIPEQGKVYSVNEGYYQYWDAPTREAIEYFKGSENPLGKPYSARYIGSLVADFHRSLLNGGIYMYPADYRSPGKPKGKLRYLCEASPLAYLAEHAGGAATDGTTRILELQPEELHERVPLFIGSKNDVQAVAEIYNNFDKVYLAFTLSLLNCYRQLHFIRQFVTHFVHNYVTYYQ